MIDFAVIGGGIAGVSAAAALAEMGSVTLFETEPMLGYHASGRSAAMFLQTYGNAPVRALNAASAAIHRVADVLSPRGLLVVAGAGDESLVAASHNSLGAAPITVAEAVALWPILDTAVCNRAAYLEEVFDLDTDRLLQYFLRTARGNGAEIRSRCEVTSLRRIARGWEITAGTETFTARSIVNAAGAWADRIASMAGIASPGICPYRRSMARLPAPGGLDVTGWPFVDEVSERWYAKPDAGAWLVSPAEEDPASAHDAWADDMVIAEGLARYEAFVTEPVTRVETTWAGLRSFAPDRALVIGPDPADPTFLWCAGQGGYGFQTAPAASRLLADLADGRPAELTPDVVQALSPSRFRS
ncbi:NAD(P)/FAD-dependent oxidoreductase [Tropicimonas marinistellae]|uniref:NAD(P)/FAD-dependent oxidoreductase n=1 Tax=Tropicimonas marinistellae TaxID=1739787 RepID=UPI00082A9840|nr:FAD-dependent oxidoreductase [Tropicimonas marinistellae]